MPSFADKTGKRFGRLLVLGRDKNIGRRTCFVCQCDCGNVVSVKSDCLKAGHTKSCGCLKKELAGAKLRTHGAHGTQLYVMWQNMKRRCLAPRSSSYHRYGARGITMLLEWQNDFAVFQSWALSNGYHEGLSIDRIDNDKGYYPENCRFVTHKEQMRNTSRNRLYKGKPVVQWCEELDLDYGYVRRRLNFYHDPMSKFFGE